MQQRGLRTRQLECEAFLLSSTFTPPLQPNSPMLTTIVGS